MNSYLETLCGPDFAIDGPPALVPDGPEGTAGVRLRAGAPEDRRRLRYANYGATRECKGVRIFLALAPAPEDGGVVLVTASHNRSTEPPAGFLAGADDLGMTEEPVLEAGDLLICAATTLHGIRGRPGRVLEITYISSRARPTAGYPEIEAPEWVTELTAGATGGRGDDDDRTGWHGDLRWETKLGGDSRRAAAIGDPQSGREQPAGSRGTVVLGRARLPGPARRHGRGMAGGGEPRHRLCPGNAGRVARGPPLAGRGCTGAGLARERLGYGPRTPLRGWPGRSIGRGSADSISFRCRTASRSAG